MTAHIFCVLFFYIRRNTEPDKTWYTAGTKKGNPYEVLDAILPD